MKIWQVTIFRIKNILWSSQNRNCERTNSLHHLRLSPVGGFKAQGWIPSNLIDNSIMTLEKPLKNHEMALKKLTVHVVI